MFHSNFALAAQVHFNLSPKDVGFVLSYVGLIGILVNSFCIGWLTTRFAEATILKSSLSFLVLAFFVYSQATDYTHLLPILPFLSASGSAMYTVTTSILTKSVSKEDTGTILGLDHATRSFCSVIAPTVGGPLHRLFLKCLIWSLYLFIYLFIL
jgi:OCT family organic cation transporter-like MFS transporter 18